MAMGIQSFRRQESPVAGDLLVSMILAQSGLVKRYQDVRSEKLAFNESGYFVSPSERAQAQRPISPLEIIISAMWIASEGFLGSP